MTIRDLKKIINSLDGKDLDREVVINTHEDELDYIKEVYPSICPDGDDILVISGFFGRYCKFSRDKE